MMMTANIGSSMKIKWIGHMVSDSQTATKEILIHVHSFDVSNGV